MHISRIELKNWRNFSAINIELAEKTIIIGPNASGKSNLLDAIRFVRDLAKEGGGLQAAIRQRGGLTKIRSLSSRRDNRVGISLELSEEDHLEWRYELEFTQRGGGAVGEPVAQLTHEKLTKYEDDGTHKDLVSRLSQNREEYLSRFTSIEQATENIRFRDFTDYVAGINYLHIVPQLVRDPHSFVQKPGSEDFFGRDFISALSSTSGNVRSSYINKITRFLKIAVPGFESLSVDKDELGEPHLVVEFSSWRGINAKQNESQLSDGTLRLIGLLWALQFGSKPVLLEEPELSLHPEIVKRLYNVISELHVNTKRRRQVILTTHSFDFLNNAAILPEEVVLLQVDDKGVTRASNLQNHKELKRLLDSGFTVAETALKKTTPKNIDQLSLTI